MNFAIGTELSNTTPPILTPATGPVNTIEPQIAGSPEIGATLTCDGGTWTGNGPVTIAFQWMRGGLVISGATLAGYVLVGADDQAVISCQVSATDTDGTTWEPTLGINATYSAPVFSQQPTLTPTSGPVGTVFNLTLGAAGPNTILDVQTFNLDGVDRRSELVGTSWDSSAEISGTVSMQVMATNSGGSVLSDLVSVSLTNVAATVPDSIQDANWSLGDAGAGGALQVIVAAMADDGGAPIVAVEYQLDGAGGWIAGGLIAAGGFVISGLLDGQTYSVALRVQNSVGAGAESGSKTANPTAGANPTVAITTINRITSAVELSGVSETGDYFGLVNYSGNPLTGAAIEMALNAGSADSVVGFSIASGANSGVHDKSNVAVGVAYFHGTVKNAAGNFSTDVPLAFIQPFVDLSAPVLQSTTPTNGASNQPPGTGVFLNFDENIQLATGQVVLFDVASSSVFETYDVATGLGDQGGTITAQNLVVTITPGMVLTDGGHYAIGTRESGAIVDTAGNAFAGWVDDNTQLSFTTSVAGAGVNYIGDVSSDTWAVNHVLGAGSVSQTALPVAFTGGKYVMLVAVAANRDVVTLALDGVAATLRASATSGTERVAVYDVTISGGGNALVQLGLSGYGDDVGVAIWEVGSRSFVNAVTGTFANRKTDLPADLAATTIAGDAILATVLHSNTSATSTWAGLNEVVASRVLSDRVFAAADNLSANGGSPEAFSWAPSINWVGVGAALAIYR